MKEKEQKTFPDNILGLGIASWPNEKPENKSHDELYISLTSIALKRSWTSMKLQETLQMQNNALVLNSFFLNFLKVIENLEISSFFKRNLIFD